jgi:hypothetical protein
LGQSSPEKHYYIEKFAVIKKGKIKLLRKKKDYSTHRVETLVKN